MKLTPNKLAIVLNKVRGDEAFMRNGVPWDDLSYDSKLTKICEARTIIRAIKIIKKLESIKLRMEGSNDGESLQDDEG